jgi:hypothetical protein
MSYQLCPNDLTDREWEYIKPSIPAAKPGGGKRRLEIVKRPEGATGFQVVAKRWVVEIGL